jgi:hypothetical protein
MEKGGKYRVLVEAQQIGTIDNNDNDDNDKINNAEAEKEVEKQFCT